MTYKNLLKAGSSILLLGSVAACGDNVDPVPDPIEEAPTPTPTTAGTFPEEFGSEFAAIFNRDPTEDPVDPQKSDVPPLAPADDPLDNDG